MNVSNIAGNHTVVVQHNGNAMIEHLQKQKMELAQQKEKVQASQMDAKTKLEKVKEITEKIAEVDQQIMQAQIEERRQEIEAAQQKNAEKQQQAEAEKASAPKEEAVLLSASLHEVLAAHRGVNTFKELHGIHNRLEREGAIATTEAKKLKSSTTPYQTNVMSRTSDHMQQIRHEASKAAKDVHARMVKAQELGLKSAQTAVEHKIERDRSDNTTAGDETPVTVNKTEREDGVAVSEAELARERARQRQHQQVDVWA